MSAIGCFSYLESFFIVVALNIMDTTTMQGRFSWKYALHFRVALCVAGATFATTRLNSSVPVLTWIFLFIITAWLLGGFEYIITKPRDAVETAVEVVKFIPQGILGILIYLGSMIVFWAVLIFAYGFLGHLLGFN